MTEPILSILGEAHLEIDLLVEVLRKVEWTNMGKGEDLFCPWCFQEKAHGHEGGVEGGFYVDCPVGAALERNRPADPGS